MLRHGCVTLVRLNRSLILSATSNAGRLPITRQGMCHLAHSRNVTLPAHGNQRKGDKAMRALLTSDGYLFLNTSFGVWTDGDLVFRSDDLVAESGDELIDDVSTRPELADRVARILASMGE